MIRVIKAAERHHADHGWLKTNWLFSFSDYYDPDNLQFGTLRVFNDDIIAPETGFGTHGHRDMEIVTVMLSGAITHRDSMGNQTVINAGEVQRMSAGSGIMHSEHNRGNVPVHMYQVWFPPRHEGARPSYQQKSFAEVPRQNRLLPLVSGFPEAGALTMDADAQMSTSDLDAGAAIAIRPRPGHGLFLYLTSGALTVNGTPLEVHDQARIIGETTVDVKAVAASSLIAIEVAGV